MSFLDDMFKRDRASIDILTEAVNYGEMFNDVIAFSKKYGPSSMEEQVKALVSSARKVLRKQDRIVWFLRWAKVEIMEEILVQGERKEGAAAPAKLLATKFFKEMGQKTGRSADSIPNEMTEYARHLLSMLEHFLLLPIHAIASVVFAGQTPRQLLDGFEKAETAWKAEAKDAFQEDDKGVEEVISFPDGFGWYLLNKAYCNKEARSMGHCGNAPRQDTSDNILSLRKRIERGDAVLMKPYATFILNGDGRLGEMKGRFNEKPDDSLHPYIVALLKNDIVTGIRGGGYAPENNFSLDDLPEHEKDELLEEKPELGGFGGMYRKYGASGEVLDEAEEILSENRNMRPPTFRVHGKQVQLQEWTDLSRMLSDVQDELMAAMVEAYEDAVDGQNLEVTKIDDEDLYDIIKGMRTTEYRRLMAALGLDPVSPNSGDFHRSIRLAARELRRSVLFDDLLEAAGLSGKADRDVVGEMQDRIVEYLEAGFHFLGGIQFIKYDETKPLTGPVSLWASADDICEMVADHQDGYYEGNGAHHWDQIEQAQSWTSVDEYHYENRKEAGLSDAQGRDTSARDDAKFAELLNGLVVLDIPKTITTFVKIAGL